MKKTIVVFGLYHTLVEFEKSEIAKLPETYVVPKDGCLDFIKELRKIKKMYKGVDFYIISNLEPRFIEAFLNKTKSRDVFNQRIGIRFNPSTVTSKIYHSLWHKILNYRSKKVFEIDGYDKVILIDCIKKQRLDFLSLKFRKLFFRNCNEYNKFNNGLWGYIFSSSFDKTLKQLKKIMLKDKGIIVK